MIHSVSASRTSWAIPVDQIAFSDGRSGKFIAGAETLVDFLHAQQRQQLLSQWPGNTQIAGKLRDIKCYGQCIQQAKKSLDQIAHLQPEKPHKKSDVTAYVWNGTGHLGVAVFHVFAVEVLLNIFQNLIADKKGHPLQPAVVKEVGHSQTQGNKPPPELLPVVEIHFGKAYLEVRLVRNQRSS